MFTPAILYKGHFDLAAIAVTVVDEAWQSSAAYEALVQEVWTARVAAVASRGHRLWDGRFYRVSNVPDIESGLTQPGLRLGTIRYRYVATYGALHTHHAAEGLAPLHHLTTACLVRTCDGYFLFGKRSLGGAIDLIGGGVQPEELPVTRGADLEANLRKEILEEMGVANAHIRSLHGVGVLLSSTSNVLIIGAVDLVLSRDEVAGYFAQRSDDEMSELVAVREEDLNSYLGSMTDYRKLIPGLL
jgi:8-oxo-dGTP pyrophosphatase MutT (NUDIX family)